MSQFGNNFLDAEFWFGREGFAESQNAVSQPLSDTLWSFLRVIAFDEPSVKMHSEPFERRYSAILSYFPLEHPFLVTATRGRCKTGMDVVRFCEGVIEGGGEGVVFRWPMSVYKPGRSSLLIKLKAARGDNEALVIGIDTEDLHLKLPDEQTFRAPKPNFQPMPKLGDIVMFTYDNTTYTHLPIRPRVYRVRTDLSWDDVIRKSAQTVKQLNEYSKKVIKMPLSHWVVKRGKNTRAFLEKFAKERKFDPRVPKNWYSISGSDFVKYAQGADGVLRPFKGSFIKAVTFAFPELKLDPLKFKIAPSKFWKSVENRRRLFKYIARKSSFDYLIPSNWYPITNDAVSHFKGVRVVLTKYYNNSLSKALVHVFPDINWHVGNFVEVQKDYWSKQKNQRNLFESIAQQNQFDPLVPENWQNFDFAILMAHKGVKEVISRYDGSLTRTLAILFPEAGFEPSAVYMNWGERRKLFSTMVSSFGMDPLVPGTWYNLTRDLVASHWGIRSVLACYRGNLGQAVSHLFPEIKVDTKRIPSFSFAHRSKSKV